MYLAYHIQNERGRQRAAKKTFNSFLNKKIEEKMECCYFLWLIIWINTNYSWMFHIFFFSIFVYSSTLSISSVRELFASITLSQDVNFQCITFVDLTIYKEKQHELKKIYNKIPECVSSVHSMWLCVCLTVLVQHLLNEKRRNKKK